MRAVLPRFGFSLRTFLVASTGAFAGQSVQNLALVAATTLGLASYMAPELGALMAITVKPFVDCFWAVRPISLGDVNINVQSLIGALIPVALAITAISKGWMRSLSLVEVAAGTYVLLVLLSAAVSPFKLKATVAAARIILPFAFLLVGKRFGRSHAGLMVLACAISTYGFVPVVTGGAQIMGLIGAPEGSEPMPSGVYRISGLYYHPLDIAVRCCIAIPFTIYLARALPQRAWRLGGLMWGVIMSAVAATTLVRSAMIALGVQILGLAWFHGRRLAVGAAFLLVLVVSSLTPPIRQVFVHALTPLAEGNLYDLGTGRGVLFAAQVIGFVNASTFEKLAGRGLSTANRVIVDYVPIPIAGLERAYAEWGGIGSHNQVLRVLTESGLLGLGALVFFIGSVVIACLRICWRAHCAREVDFAVSVLVVLAAVGIFSLTTIPLDSPPITWPLWLVVGAIVGIDPNKRESPDADEGE